VKKQAMSILNEPSRKFEDVRAEADRVSLKNRTTGIIFEVREVPSALVLSLSIPDSYWRTLTPDQLRKMLFSEMSPQADIRGMMLRLVVPLSRQWLDLTKKPG
jgi:hypothetical protein